MPNYTFVSKETNEELTITTSMSKLDELTKDMNDNGFERVYNALPLVSQSGSNLSKTDNGWKDVLRRAKSNSGRKNTINV